MVRLRVVFLKEHPVLLEHKVEIKTLDNIKIKRKILMATIIPDNVTQ